MKVLKALCHSLNPTTLTDTMTAEPEEASPKGEGTGEDPTGGR